MTILTIKTHPIPGQKPGTSGLRKKVPQFQQPHYLENFIQAIFKAVPSLVGGTLVLGGDGRFYNTQATQVILKMAAANGVARVIVAKDGLLSTPAASHLIRQSGAEGGVILSASHNPGGPEGDFGVKFNAANGGPAPEKVTEAIYQATLSLNEYRICDDADIDVSQLGKTQLGAMQIDIVDPVAAYVALMQKLIDFDAISEWLKAGHHIRLDGLHAIGGPYLDYLFSHVLGSPNAEVVNAVPLVDFGGGHPDPNPVYAADLVHYMQSSDAPDFAAAFDGDADRNMILGRGIVVTPSDSLAVLAANAHLIPQFRDGVPGVARSMPTSRAVDKVAEALGFACYETPTGWKFFGNLLDAGRIALCGEESYGTGGNHVREKDGVWTALCWLNLLAARRESVADILRAHWARFGRHYYSRHDYEGIATEAGDAIFRTLRGKLSQLPGQTFGGDVVTLADDFAYTDPVDGSISEKQGVRIEFASGARIVFRLSGTGTEGATLRVYLERYAQDAADHAHDTQRYLSTLIEAANQIAQIEQHSGRRVADVVT